MNNLTFEYKGRKLFISVQKSQFSSEVIFYLCDVTDMDNEIVDFSIKELAKVEILDYIKNDLQKDFKKTIVATQIVPLKTLLKDQYNVLLKVKKELLKEFDNEDF